jgi:flagellar assembly factor FliW
VQAVKHIESKAYGKVEVDEASRVIFEQGLYGLENFREYYILDYKEGPFYWLQSAEMPEIAFVIIDPCYFKKDYQLEVAQADFKSIGFSANPEKATEDLLHFVIVTIPEEDPSQMTANLLGPVIINTKTRLAKQAISLNPEYTTQHNILEELEKMTQGGD